LQFLGLLEHVGCSPQDLTGVSLASVVPPITRRIIQACQSYLNQPPFLVCCDIKTGVTILYDDPSAVGADRICDAAAVQRLYGGPACIVDFGTATTFNAINKNGDYLGGAIAAGLGIAADALFHRTSKLPRVDLQVPPSVIGRNTVHAMQSGLVNGYVAMTEGMIARFRRELGPEMKVIATGGLAEVIAPQTDQIQIHAPWLTLEGLRIIWELNRDHD
ncbi:MAG TPA: type III pantothenate kinase, partial [Anaerolineaceae bacterium]|nr:type III pantothenate kinase [Anaerolineaceae bacterium]